MRAHRHAFRTRWLTAVGILWALTACSVDLTDWEVYPADDDNPLPERPIFGVGLTVNLAVCIQQHESHLCTPPRDLEVIADAPSKVRITIGGHAKLRRAYYNDVEGKNARLVRVEVLEPGPNRLRFISDDSEEVESLSYEARSPATFKGFSTLNGTTRTGKTEHTGSELWAFTGSSLEVRARFQADGVPVLGTRPWRLDAPAGSGTTLDLTQLQFGAGAHDVTLDVEGAPGPLRIHVRPPSDITGIALRSTSASITQLDGTSLTIQQGYNAFLLASPLHAGEVPLIGWPHPPPSVEVIRGTAVVPIGCGSPPDCLGLRAETLGEAELRFTWGSAVKHLQARVVPRP